MADEEKLDPDEEAAIKRAAQMNAELMTRVGQKPGEPLTVASLRKDGEAMVLVSSPHEFFYRPDHSKLVLVKQGAQEIPAHLVEHFWFAAHGVKPLEIAASAPAGVAYAPGTPELPADAEAAKVGRGRKGAN